MALCAGTAWQVWQAALSAQRSLGGQDARRCADHCQNGRADVCLASQRDGVICPQDSCDIDDGIRHNHLAARQRLNGLSWADYWMGRGQPDVAHDFDAFSRAEAWALQRFPGSRQPVAQLTDAEIDARLNTLYRELVASGQHNGGMSGVAWDRAVYRMASTMPLPEPPKEADDGR